MHLRQNGNSIGNFLRILIEMNGLIRDPDTLIWKIEGKAMIRNRYNYPTPPIRDIKGKETQTRNN